MAALGPIIIHSQNMNSIKALDEYFESPCIQYIEKVRTDGRNLYIDFKPMNNREKIREFITPNFVLKYNGEIFYFTHQFYDL